MDFQTFELEKLHWSELSQGDNSPLAFLNLAKLTSKLPDPLYYEIFTAYNFLCSPLCKIAPLLFLCGSAGSGKSQLGILASKLHGTRIFSPSDSFAAVRNYINLRKWGVIATEIYDEETNDYTTIPKRIEKPIFLIWDDFDKNKLLGNPDIYRMLKVGYNRDTSTISIAGSKRGEIQEFDTFSPKILSSITPFHLDDEFSELARRMLLIRTKKIEDFTLDELANCDDEELIDSSEINWADLQEIFNTFWSDEANIRAFLLAKRALQREFQKSKDLIFDSNQKLISLELGATAIALHIWKNPIHAIDKLTEYWANKAAFDYLARDFSEKLLDDFLDEIYKESAKLQRSPEFSHTRLKNQISLWEYDCGERLDLRDIKYLLKTRGFFQQKHNWIKF